MEERRESDQESLRVLSVYEGAGLPATAGSRRYYMGVVDKAGFTLKAMYWTGVVLALDTANYWTFVPFVSVRNANATYTLKYLGTPKGTNANAVNPDTPFRIHSEESLEYDVPEKSAVGVEVRTTATPTANKRGTFSATLYHA